MLCMRDVNFNVAVVSVMFGISGVLFSPIGTCNICGVLMFTLNLMSAAFVPFGLSPASKVACSCGGICGSAIEGFIDRLVGMVKSAFLIIGFNSVFCEGVFRK